MSVTCTRDGDAYIKEINENVHFFRQMNMQSSDYFVQESMR